MATRIKMLKLLQETRGHANFTNRRFQPRPPGALLWQIPSPRIRRASVVRKKTVTVLMQDPPNIPDAVAIKHLPAQTVPVHTAAP